MIASNNKTWGKKGNYFRATKSVTTIRKSIKKMAKLKFQQMSLKNRLTKKKKKKNDN